MPGEHITNATSLFKMREVFPKAFLVVHEEHDYYILLIKTASFENVLAGVVIGSAILTKAPNESIRSY